MQIYCSHCIPESDTRTMGFLSAKNQQGAGIECSVPLVVDPVGRRYYKSALCNLYLSRQYLQAFSFIITPKSKKCNGHIPLSRIALTIWSLFPNQGQVVNVVGELVNLFERHLANLFLNLTSLFTLFDIPFHPLHQFKCLPVNDWLMGILHQI